MLVLQPQASLLIDQIEEPLIIWNTLTNEAHGYASVDDALAGRNEFEFDITYKPGIYGIKNNTMGILPVLLFNTTYNVNPGTEWRFIAHDEIGSRHAWMRNAAMARIVRSYWDTALGGSYWDDDQSIWDGVIDM